MVSSSNETDSKKVGVFVLTEFFGLEDSGFISAACSQPVSHPLPNNMYIEWHYPDQHPEGDRPFFSCTYTCLHPNKYKLILLGSPLALGYKFLLSDLQFPFRIAGCVLIFNLYRAFSEKVYIANQGDLLPFEKWYELKDVWERESARSPELLSAEWITTEFKKRINQTWWSGGIAWIRKNGLPFVVATVEPKSPVLSLDEMLDLLELEPQIPIISCSLEFSGEEDIDDEQVYLPFSRESIERVLSTLVEQIEAEGL